MLPLSSRFAFSLAVAAFGVLTLAANSTLPQRPNILVILSDDQDLKLNSLVHMSTLQKLLVQEGTFFNKHYGHVSQCCPGRATIWTGKHAHNTNVTGILNGTPGGGMKQFASLGWNKKYLPVWMQKAGYNTYYGGKFINGFTWPGHCQWGCLEGWNEAHLLYDPTTYFYYNSSYAYFDGKNWTKEDGTNSGKYSTDQIAENVANFIEGQSKSNSGKPWFAVAAPVAPHIPAIPKNEYNGTYKDLPIFKSPNFNPENQTGVTVIWDLPRLEQPQLAIIERGYQQRQECLMSVDDLIETLITKLTDTGFLDNTYIIYTSDNGYHLGNHRLQGGKFQCFEEDINLPFIIRGPNVGKNVTTDLVSGHIDIAPTILGLAGYGDKASMDEIGLDLDGTPITFPLADQADLQRNIDARGDQTHLEFWGPFWEEWGSGHRHYNTDLNTYKALRLQSAPGAKHEYNLMYSVWCQDAAHELYDMTWDPYQMSNLHPDAPKNTSGTNAYDAGYQTMLGRPIENVIQRLDALVLVLKTCSGEDCRWPWKQLHHNGTEPVNTLMDALDPKYDNFYAHTYSVAQVGWEECYTGYGRQMSSTLYKLSNEQPAWVNQQIRLSVKNSSTRATVGINLTTCLLAWAIFYGLKSIIGL